MNAPQWDDVEAIAYLEGYPREEAVNAFLRDNQHLFVMVSRTLCRRYSLGESMVDDVAQEVMMVAYSLFDDDVRAKAARFPSWLNAVSLMSQNRVKSLSESAEVTGSRGMSSVVRRRRALAKFRAEWEFENNKISSDTELVEAFNQKMLSTRSNAARQGMIATVDDLRPFDPVEYDPTLDVPSLGHDSDCPLVPHEAVSLIEVGIARCFEVSEELGRCASAYYGDALGDPPHISTTAEVAATVNLSSTYTRKLMRDVDDVMRDVAASDFGITRP